MTNRTTLSVSSEHLATLRALAERLGYVTQRGPLVGEGSVSALIRAIADGELEVKQPEFDSPTRRFLGL